MPSVVPILNSPPCFTPDVAEGDDVQPLAPRATAIATAAPQIHRGWCPAPMWLLPPGERILRPPTSMQLYLRVMKSRKVVSPRFGAPADTADVSAVGLASLTAEYETRTGASRTLHERLTRSLAGGETRAVTFYEPYPVAVVEASGARFTDADGNEYLDLNNNMASLIHGHAYPPVMKALREAGSVLGTVQAGAHAPLLELAELLVARFPGFERVRFTNSGSEAAILALRIARRATGRRQVVLFEGGYHGM